MRLCCALTLGIVIGIAFASRGDDPADAQPTSADDVRAPGLGEEQIPDAEKRDIEELLRLQLGGMISSTPDGRPTARGQHPKHHGFVVAKFTVLADLPEALKVGIFREPRTYTCVIRYSNGASMFDAAPDVHGMAIKVLGVKGNKALEEENQADTQDFVLLDHPIFFAENPRALAEFVKARAKLAADKDLQERLSKLPPEERPKAVLEALAAVRPKEARIQAVIGEQPLRSSPLAMEYFSTVPYKFGPTAAKYRAKPEDAYEPSRTKKEGKDYLRAAMVEQLTTDKRPARFGFYVQLQENPNGMPIEDPTVAWKSDWQKVATIEINAQDFDFPGRIEWGNRLSYTPWHALKEHRPLGGINRARKEIYAASSRLRHANMDPPPKEPTEAEIPTRGYSTPGSVESRN
jgi:catalase